MTRVENWPLLLADAIEAASERPFCWGQHDCATWAFEIRHTLMGGEDVAARWRGRYRTARGAERVMRRLGWESLQAMGRDLLGPSLPTPRLAQRGDLVLRRHGSDAPSAFGICIGARAAFVSPGGLVVMPLDACSHAWRV